MANEYKPYIDPKENLKELTLPPLVLGAIMAVVLGAANAYLGLKAGMIVAAVFPAAVISMAVLRMFKGNILEENISRTTGAVGEALAAGAIFTIPAFVMVGAWTNLDFLTGPWFLATGLLVVGGLLGVLLMILLRRTFMEDASLPFPEAQACTEIVKAGQGGETGAGSVFAAMGVAGALEFLKSGFGVGVIGGHHRGAFKLGEDSQGAIPFFTPNPSPAFLAVGYIIGPKYGALVAAGGLFGWMLLMPVMLFMMASSDGQFSQTLNGLVETGDWDALFGGALDGTFVGLSKIYDQNIKMIAIGAMIVGAFFTLFRMRNSLITGVGRSVKALGGGKGEEKIELLRTDKDISIKLVFVAILLMAGAMFGLYLVLCGSLFISVVMTIVMLIMTFLFAAVAGYLVAIIGSSSNPISGLTLSTLLIAAGLLVLLGMGGGYLDDGVTMSEAMRAGVIAVLGVATVVCCVAGVAGDMAQDWKAGWNLGGTPWRMEIGGFIGVVASALFLVSIISLLHNTEVKTNLEKALRQGEIPAEQIGAVVAAVGDQAGKVEGIDDATRLAIKALGLTGEQVEVVDAASRRVRGIGSDSLPAPQAGLMATTANGIISGSLPWELILMGMLFALALIFVGVPSPMLVAVGMYLPFATILAIFVGGLFQWIANNMARKKGADDTQMEAVSNRGLLVASGFVAGEALMGIILAILVTAEIRLVEDHMSLKWLGGLVILFLAWYLIAGSLKALKTAPAAPAGKPEGGAE